jgi:hypothetical protein
MKEQRIGSHTIIYKIIIDMKYLKKFNEEYSSQTYRKIAREVEKRAKDLPTSTLRERSIKSDLETRAQRIKDHSKFIENIENLAKWEDELKIHSPFGFYNLTVENPETGETLNGEFALSIHFDELAFSDEPEYGIGLFVGIIPSSKELVSEYLEKFPDCDMDNGFIWSMIVSLQYDIIDGQVIMKKFEISDYDGESYGSAVFTNRRSAENFKSLLVNIFSNKDLNYPSGYRDVDTIWEKLESCILAENSFSSDYGFKLEDVANFISSKPTREIGYLN